MPTAIWANSTVKNSDSNKNEEFICDVLASAKYWEKIFTRLDEHDLSLLRCYLMNGDNYKKCYNDIVIAGLERRVSPMREEFVIDII